MAQCTSQIELDRYTRQNLPRNFAALAGRDQVNVGMVSAGDYPNRLPALIIVTGTRRWKPGSSEDERFEELAEICGV